MYPTNLPTHDDFLANETLSAAAHSTKHNDVFDELEAIETKLGVDNSAVNTSIDYLLKNIASSNPGHKHTFVNGATDISASVAEVNKLVGITSDVVGKDDVQTLTNKTLNSPIFSAGAVKTADILNANVTADKLATGLSAAGVATSETTASTSYTDLATAGPAVTVTIGANGIALIIITCNSSNSNAGTANYMGWAASGANTIAAADADAYIHQNATATAVHRGSVVMIYTSLTAGSTTFTAKYRVAGGTGTFVNRAISVIPL